MGPAPACRFKLVPAPTTHMGDQAALRQLMLTDCTAVTAVELNE